MFTVKTVRYKDYFYCIIHINNAPTFHSSKVCVGFCIINVNLFEKAAHPAINTGGKYISYEQVR